MRIAVLISGGFDSAVLWHMINNLYAGTDANIIPVTVPKTDGSIRYANMMLEDYCKRNKIKRIHTTRVGNVDTTNREPEGEVLFEQLLSGLREILTGDKPLADVVYTGASPYPEHLYKRYAEIIAPRDRQFTRGTEYAEQVKQPFDTYTKDMLVALAMDFKIVDDIKEITHSCVVQSRGRCGECFWCEEREWALQQHGLMDGTN